MSSRTVALLYHGFAVARRDNDPSHLFVTVDQLRTHLALLSSRGWVPLTLDDWLAGRRGFLLTIDDGYSSVLHLAAGVLADARVPALLFVPPALAGTDQGVPEPILDREELRRLQDKFHFELGVHGLDHTPMAGLSDHELVRQTADARDAFAELTGVRPRAFAYPHGLWDERAARAVEAAGYDVGFAVHDDGGTFARSRVAIYSRDTTATFTLKLALRGDRFGILRRSRGRARRHPAA